MRRNKKYTYDGVKEYIESLGYTLIDKIYKNVFTNMTFKDDEDFYYYACIHNLQKGFTPPRFNTSNPYTIQNMKLWYKLNDKPFELLDGQEYKGNKEKLKWQCLKEECMDIFEATFSHILSHGGCGVCHGKQVGLSNCFATKNPDLAKEWHPTKNGDLTPYDVTCGSDIEIWWQCKENYKHVWKSTVGNRSLNGNGCPCCVGKLAYEDNNLLICNPELCKEWDYDKNDKNPEDYTPGSSKYANWICKKCGYKWRSIISDRNRGVGCPQCNESKGEKKIKRILDNNNFIVISQKNYIKLNIVDKFKYIYYIPQKKFTGLIGLGGGLLSYDFYIPNYNLLIEYQGEFHDGTAKLQTKKQFKQQVEHDRRKREYVQNNNIKLLEIWYWDFDNIEEILKRELMI